MCEVVGQGTLPRGRGPFTVLRSSQSTAKRTVVAGLLHLLCHALKGLLVVGPRPHSPSMRSSLRRRRDTTDQQPDRTNEQVAAGLRAVTEARLGSRKKPRMMGSLWSRCEGEGEGLGLEAPARGDALAPDPVLGVVEQAVKAATFIELSVPSTVMNRRAPWARSPRSG